MGSRREDERVEKSQEYRSLHSVDDRESRDLRSAFVAAVDREEEGVHSEPEGRNEANVDSEEGRGDSGILLDRFDRSIVVDQRHSEVQEVGDDSDSVRLGIRGSKKEFVAFDR